MSKEILETRYKKWFNATPSSLVQSQINKLVREGYTYLDISNAIWYTFLKLRIPNDLETYGIHYVTRYIEESVLYFKSLERKARETEAILKNRTENPVIKVKRQKQKLIKKEYDWDNVE